MESIKIHPEIPEVSRVCLGTWAIGGWMWGGADDQLSIQTIHHALELGINFIDTAPVYGFGRAEEVLGKAIQGRRDQVVIATKAGLEWTPSGKVFRNATPRRLRKEIEDSLKRLRTDYIDLYQVHWPDSLVPFERSAEVMVDLLKQGKVRAVGVSNYDVAAMKDFTKICPIQTTQPPYNLFERQIEEEIFAYTEEKKITTLAYGALCRGLLSGRMAQDTTFEGDDLRKVDPKFKSPRFEQYIKAVSALDEYAQKNFSKQVIHLAVRWLLDRGQVVALWGARRPQQLDPITEVMDWKLGADHMQEIDNIIKLAVKDPVGPEFMGAPVRSSPGYDGEDRV